MLLNKSVGRVCKVHCSWLVTSSLPPILGFQMATGMLRLCMVKVCRRRLRLAESCSCCNLHSWHMVWSMTSGKTFTGDKQKKPIINISI